MIQIIDDIRKIWLSVVQWKQLQTDAGLLYCTDQELIPAIRYYSSRHGCPNAGQCQNPSRSNPPAPLWGSRCYRGYFSRLYLNGSVKKKESVPAGERLI